MLLLQSTFLDKFEDSLDAVLKAKDVGNRQMAHLYNRMYTFLQDYNRIDEKTICHFIRCTVKYIECITSYVSTLGEEIYAVQHFCRIIGDIPKYSEIQDAYLQEISNMIFQKVIELTEPIWFVKELLIAFDVALRYFDKNVLNRFMSDNIFSLYKLADVLTLCGDYNFQVKILEIIFHMCSASQIKEHSSSCFPESKSLQNALLSIQSATFNYDVRRFLNLINGEGRLVASVKCTNVLLDALWVGAPKGCTESDLWVDFNAGSNTISILCDANSLRTSVLLVDGNDKKAWEIITVYIPDVEGVLLSRWLDQDSPTSRGAVICFKLTKPCSTLYTSSKQAARAKQLKLLILNGTALQHLEDYVLPKMFTNNFQRLSPAIQQKEPLKSIDGGNNKFADHKPATNVISIGRYGMNTMNFESTLDLDLDHPYISFKKTALASPHTPDFRHRAKPKSKKIPTDSHIPLVDQKSWESGIESVASTHLTNCVLDYIDLTGDDDDDNDVLYNSCLQTFSQSPQNNNVQTAVVSEAYYSVPEANTTAAVFDLTDECMQPQSTELNSQYFTANETCINGSIYPSNSQYLEPVVVENRPLGKLLNIIKEQKLAEKAAVVELMPSLNRTFDSIAHESVGNIAYIEPRKMNKSDVKTSSFTEEQKYKQVSVGQISENVPQKPPKKKGTIKKSPAGKTRIKIKKPCIATRPPIKIYKNKTKDLGGSKTEAPENISDILLPTPEQSIKKELNNNTSQQVRIDVGVSQESVQSLKQPRRPIRKISKIDTPSENQDTPSENQDTPSENQDTPSESHVEKIEVPAETVQLLTKQPRVVLHKLDEAQIYKKSQVAAGNLVEEELLQDPLMQTLENQLFEIFRENEESVIQEGSSPTETTESVNVGDKCVQIKATHHIDIPQVPLKNDELHMLLTEGCMESSMVNSLVNTENIEDQQNEDPTEQYIPIQEKNEHPDQNELTKKMSQSVLVVTAFGSNIDQQDKNNFQQLIFSTEEEEKNLVHEAAVSEQDHSKNLADPKTINSHPEPLKNVEKAPSDNDKHHCTYQEEIFIFKQNMNKSNQFGVAQKSFEDNSLIGETARLSEKDNNKKEHSESNKIMKIENTHVLEQSRIVPCVQLARLNAVTDSKTEICQIDNNTQKWHEGDNSEKNQNDAIIMKSPHHISNSIILTPNDDRNKNKPYDVHTEIILSRSRKYKKQNYPKIHDKENVEASRKPKTSHVRKLYNPNNLSYTKLYTEDDFADRTSIKKFKSVVEDTKIANGPTDTGFKESLPKNPKSGNNEKIIKKFAKNKDRNVKLKRNVLDKNLTLQNEQNKLGMEKNDNTQTNNDTFTWILKKQAREKKSKIIDTYKKSKKETNEMAEQNDSLIREKEGEHQNARKRKENLAFEDELGKTKLKKRKEDNLDPFDEILTKSERAKNQKLVKTKEKLANSSKSNYSATDQGEATVRSRNDFDFTSVFDIFEKTVRFDKTFNTTTSSKKCKSVRSKWRKKTSSRDKKLCDMDVMREKFSHGGYESLYGDVEEDTKLPIKRKKSINRNTKKSKNHTPIKITPITSKKLPLGKENTMSQKKQTSSESSPLPELYCENEKEIFRIETEPRLTSSNSTIQKNSVEVVKPSKVNILSNILIQMASNNNILLENLKPPSKETKIESKNVSQTSPVAITPVLLNVQDTINKELNNMNGSQVQKTFQGETLQVSTIEEMLSASNNFGVSNSSIGNREMQPSTSPVKGQPTNEDIFKWVATGLPEESVGVIENILEVIISSQKNMIHGLLQAVHGPVPENLVNQYELLVKLDDHYTNYYNQH